MSDENRKTEDADIIHGEHQSHVAKGGEVHPEAPVDGEPVPASPTTYRLYGLIALAIVAAVLALLTLRS